MNLSAVHTVLTVCSEDHLLFLYFYFKASLALYETVTESEVSFGEENVFSKVSVETFRIEKLVSF